MFVGNANNSTNSVSKALGVFILFSLRVQYSPIYVNCNFPTQTASARSRQKLYQWRKPLQFYYLIIEHRSFMRSCEVRGGSFTYSWNPVRRTGKQTNEPDLSRKTLFQNTRHKTYYSLIIYTERCIMMKIRNYIYVYVLLDLSLEKILKV